MDRLPSGLTRRNVDGKLEHAVVKIPSNRDGNDNNDNKSSSKADDLAADKHKKTEKSDPWERTVSRVDISWRQK